MLILGPDGKPASRGREVKTLDRSWGGIYEAATRADFRGWFYVPSLDPVDQQDSTTRRVLAERSDWLYKNVGATTMVIDGLALDEVGTGLWPKWNSSNEAFNTDMTDAFHYSNFDPAVFSADAQSDFYSQQFNIRRLIRLYGDAFGQMITALPETGRPGMHIIPGWRVDNFGNEKPNERRHDGVRTTPLNRPIDYRVITSGGGQPRSSLDVPADQMLHFHDPFLPGQVRGVPALSSVSKRLFRREDIHKAMTNGTLARERMGFALQAQPNSSLSGPPIVFAGQGETSTTTNPDGSKYTVQKIFGDKAGDEIVIPELPPGTELKLLESERPGVAVNEFLDSLLREVAWATTYPPEYIFFLAGMGQGTGVRLALQKVKAVINSKREFQMKPQFIHPWVIFWAYERLRRGGVQNEPRDWYKYKTIAPADMTVDLGREGRLYDERYATNRMSIESYHGLSGEDAGDVEDSNLAVIKRRIQKLKVMNAAAGTNFEYFDIWPRSSNAQQAQAPAEQLPLPNE